MKCRICREGELEVRHESHHYHESGLPNVTLLDIEIRCCKNCGARIVSIPHIEELNRVLAFTVSTQTPRLSGAEVRFLRKYLGCSSKDFADMIGVTQETVSRWEHGREQIGPVAERLVRLIAIRKAPVEEYPPQRLSEVAQEKAKKAHIVLTAQNGWHTQTKTSVSTR